MENKNKDIIDDEFRVLGTGSSVPTGDSDEDRRRKRLGGWVALAIVALLGLGMILFWPKERVQEDEIGVFESEYESETPTVLGTDDAPQPYAEQLDTVVAGHPLKLFIPHHATPRLRVGQPNEKTLQAVMGFQAADIRADNYEILGDFVLAGEQMTKGSSKAGFCAIVDGKATVGVSRNTPLLVEAVARGGYISGSIPWLIMELPSRTNPRTKPSGKPYALGAVRYSWLSAASRKP